MKLIVSHSTTSIPTGVEGSFTVSTPGAVRTFGFRYEHIETNDRILTFINPRDKAELWSMTEETDLTTLTEAQRGFSSLFFNLLEPEIHDLQTRGGGIVNGLQAQGWKEGDLGRTRYELSNSFHVQAVGETEQAMRAVLAL